MSIVETHFDLTSRDVIENRFRRIAEHIFTTNRYAGKEQFATELLEMLQANNIHLYERTQDNERD